ncbi:MAG: hypothetical protein EBS05_18030 [Proteobacteria bacterium]|nr:hypothetical protein [Pseudomonadota bacterium]
MEPVEQSFIQHFAVGDIEQGGHPAMHNDLRQQCEDGHEPCDFCQPPDLDSLAPRPEFPQDGGEGQPGEGVQVMGDL